MRELIQAFKPNQAVSGKTIKYLASLQILFLLGLWMFATPRIIPKPLDVLQALVGLWSTGLGAELLTSFFLNLKAIAFASFLSLLLAYATVMPAFRPFAIGLSKLRFLGLTGLTFIFTLMVAGANLKTSVLVFGISVFMLTDMATVVASVPRQNFELARTLRMGEWRIVWEVIVLGQRDKVFQVIRTSAAIGWVMLTMVEGLVRSEGGIGALLLIQSKYFRLADIFAIQFVILAVGLGQDYLIGMFRKLLCPYADLTLERQ
jgi:NitT/TauT family transport system permease protein